MSACQTAAGDDQLVLGLAGVAVKSGASGALASRWAVDDQATSILFAEFYRQLTSSTEITKAESLRLAQEKLMSDLRYQHPYYESPFILIGNWM